MKLENSINYYYTVLALRLLLERGLISEDEYGKICRYNAEIFCDTPPGTPAGARFQNAPEACVFPAPRIG